MQDLTQDQGLKLPPLQWECRVLTTQGGSSITFLKCHIIVTSIADKPTSREFIGISIYMQSPLQICVLRKNQLKFRILRFYKYQKAQYGEGNGTPLQYSCLGNPMDRGAWQAAVHGVTKSRTRLSDFTFTFPFMHWRRKWQPTPVFLPGESQGRGSLVGCHLWGRTESDTTEATQQQKAQYTKIAQFVKNAYF